MKLTLLSNPLTGMVQSGFKATGTQFRVQVTDSLSCRFSSRQVQVPSDLVDEKDSVGPAPCVVTVSTACHMRSYNTAGSESRLRPRGPGPPLEFKSAATSTPLHLLPAAGSAGTPFPSFFGEAVLMMELPRRHSTPREGGPVRTH